MMPNDAVDDATIAEDATLWRRVPPDWVIFDPNLGRKRPTSQAFEDSRGSPMSAFLAQECAETSNLLAGHPGFLVVSLTARMAREVGLKIVRDPLAAGPRGHVLVVGKKTGKIRDTLAKSCNWVTSP